MDTLLPQAVDQAPAIDPILQQFGDQSAITLIDTSHVSKEPWRDVQIGFSLLAGRFGVMRRIDLVFRMRRDECPVVSLARHTSEKKRRHECRIGRSNWPGRLKLLFKANSRSIAIDDQHIKNYFCQHLRKM